MRLSETGELSLLDILRKRFGRRAPGLVLGIGDDSAVIRPRSENLLLTSDMMVEGVHFDLKWMTPYQLGFKLVSVNVSDIYAMGGRPEFMLLDFAAPGDFEMSQFNSLFDGIAAALKIYRLSLIGGDISAADKVVLSATVSGSAARFVGRGGAKPGDLIYVSGPLGDSACGLKVLQTIGRTVVIEEKKKVNFGPGWKTIGPLIRKHLMPLAVEPRGFSEATAMMDISDGLFIDLSKLCRESGVGAIIYSDKIPMSEGLRRTAGYLGVDPLDFATGGGEDYELLFTAPARLKVDAFCIGEITKRGLRIAGCEGKIKEVLMRGYRHFAL